MVHCFDDQSILRVPGAGPAMQCWDERGLDLLEAAAQHLDKQVVVAVPAPLVIKRDYKQIGALECFQHRLPLLLFCHCLAEGAAELLQDSSTQQERLHRRRLPCQYFLGEAIQHVAMTAAEGGHEPGDIASATQGERSALESSYPAFRPMLPRCNGLRTPT